MRPMSHLRRHVRDLKTSLPWTATPLVVGAPMRVISGPALAVAVSGAGGLGFIGPGENPSALEPALAEASELVAQSSSLSALLSPPWAASPPGLLPVGVGFQTWAGDLAVSTRILHGHPPAVAWLFAPRHGQRELDEWTRGIRAASPRTQVWIQVASVAEAVAAARSDAAPDALVVQGTDAGGHSRTQGAGVVTLLPEVADALSGAEDLPLIAAGGISDARGLSAALALGAAGVALGTRLLAAREAHINPGYQRHVLAAGDGGQSTVRTQLYNHLRGTTDWPEGFDARGLVNQSWRDHEAGVPFEANRERHAEAMKKGEDGWGSEEGRMATYAGTGVGLVKDVKGAAEIVREMRSGVGEVLREVSSSFG